MRGDDYAPKWRPKKRWATFDKMRVLITPERATIEYASYGDAPFMLKYGPQPEHMIRRYKTLELATAAGRRFAAKFQVKLVVTTEAAIADVATRTGTGPTEVAPSESEVAP
jgi:hypothetical protein